ncbi:unnamed protein product [Zymoseptoria tritici ST99CH_3D1]|nr:unnamed protein product [Zymoseptoria tritici ST99CH_3D1]
MASLTIPFLTSVLLIGGVQALELVRSVDNTTATCATACSTLRTALPGKVFGASDTAGYQESKSEYFSDWNGDINPACFVVPTEAEDVALIVKTAKDTHCPFAAKSGGHTYFESASNIENGITIDFRGLNQVTPNGDGTVSLGPGGRWGDVYDTLDPLNITVLGGRLRHIGVGGLLLGGGTSFLTPEHGFACDNICRYQVVNADGEIIWASQETNSDLFWALRGGASNFGLVVRFDVDAVPGSNFWGGTIDYDISQLQSVASAFGALADPKTKDDKATTWIVVVRQPAANSWTINTVPVYSEPVTETPKIFEPFVKIPSTKKNLRIARHGVFANESMDAPNGFRCDGFVITMKFNTDIVEYAVNKAKSEPFSNNTQLLAFTLGFQQFGQTTLTHTNVRGGNPMGLGDSGPLIMIQVQFLWLKNESSPLDQEFQSAGQQFIADLGAWAKEQGHENSYLYLNYADKSQDVFGSYGQANEERLQRIAKQYDPDGVFQKLMPGGLKLF